MKVSVSRTEDQLFAAILSRPAMRFTYFAICPWSDRDRDAAELPPDSSKLDGDGASSKRRHSRPLVLDSEGEENDTSGKEEELLSDREEEPEESEAPDGMLSGKVPAAAISYLLFHFLYSPNI